MTQFKYHEADDVAVFEHGNYDKYEKSVDVANFVVDLDEDGEFLGLEVVGASERLPLTKDELSDMEDVEITIQEEEDAMMVTIVLRRDGKKTSLNLPVKGLTGQTA